MVVCFKVPVGHPSEIDEIFDAISYSKGASVIRMLHDFIGDQVETFEYFVSYYKLHWLRGAEQSPYIQIQVGNCIAPV